VEPKEQLGRNLRRLRKERELSQMELGFLIGMDLAEVSRLENGHHDPGLSKLTRIALGLDVGFDVLLDGILPRDPNGAPPKDP
jgi:transcriptional regulator with XRE-family HTH domain